MTLSGMERYSVTNCNNINDMCIIDKTYMNFTFFMTLSL